MAAYATFAQWQTRAQSTTQPVTAAGSVNQARVEALLEDAAAWCMDVVPGALIDCDGDQIPLADLAGALQQALIHQSFRLVNNWLMPRKEATSDKEMRGRCPLIPLVRKLAYGCVDEDDDCDDNGNGNGAPDETPLDPSMPVVTPHTNYLLASVNQVFTAPEVVVMDTNSALEVPAGTVPAGERRYFAYARAASEGAFSYIYLYPAGHRDPQSQIAGFIDAGDTTEIGGVEQRLLRSRVSYGENANGTVFEAG